MKIKAPKRAVPTTLTLAALLLAAPLAQAQIGSGWSSYSPTQKIHLDNESGLQIYDWTSYKSVCSPTCADYQYTSSSDTHRFRILDNRSNRSEIRVHNDYSSGSRQFQGYVKFSSPLNDESLFQIFGSTSGATQMMIRGYNTSGGTIRSVGTPSVTVASGIYGVENRINVIHVQGSRIEIYRNGSLRGSGTDNESVSNYHKYGCYGTLTTSAVTVYWRAVRHYRK